MQISSPIQAPGSGESDLKPDGVTGDSPALWGRANNAAQKKNKLGIFAKLLEGLTAKGKKSALSGVSENAEGASDPESLGFDAVKTGQNTKKTQKTGIEPGISEDDSHSGTVFAEVRNGELQIQEHWPLKTDQEGPVAKEKAVSEAGVSLTRAGQDPSPEFPEEMNQKEALNEAVDSPGEPLTRADRKAESNVSAGKVKNSVPAAESQPVSFRAPELAEAGPVFGAQLRNPEGLQELRSRRSRPNIEVRDLRTGEVREAEAKTPALNTQRPVSEIELPVNLNLYAERGDEPADAAGESPQRLSFEEALARELRGDLSADIVRDATVIVRNGGEGTIRLSLRPASLGDVKIRLEMTENKITGRIIVGSNEALRAFERELPVLEKAFRDSGFSETSLEMSLAQDGSGFGAGEQRQDNLSPFQAASRYEAGTEWTDAPDAGGKVASASGRINLFI
jgi:flagellar hook-length control protein FliK